MSTKQKFSFTFVILVALSVTSIIVSNIIAGKLWLSPIGAIFTVGTWLFPIVYILGDVIPEVYGLATARKVIFLGFAMNVFAIAFFFLCLKLPYPPFWANQSSFEIVLGFTPRLLLASFVGYLVGSNANAWTLVAIKKLTQSKYLWMRTISSTLVGETLDSLCFVLIAFAGTLPASVLGNMILSMTAFKIVYEIIATPITYLVVGYVKKVEDVTI